MMKCVLSIAGSDPSGGAGIQADLKTIAAHGMYGMAVPAVLTAQNTMGVRGLFQVPADFVRAQIEAVMEDIMPAAVKVGMSGEAETVRVIARCLRDHGAPNLVVDPVMVSTSGRRLMSDEAKETLVHELLPLATLITPNIPEAAVLSGIDIRTQQDMERAAGKIVGEMPGAVLIKGGHADGNADDLLWQQGRAVWIRGERLTVENSHGTGCTLSTAVACGLAEGKSLEDAVRDAKEYLTGALKHEPGLGKGNGPIAHLWKYGRK